MADAVKTRAALLSAMPLGTVAGTSLQTLRDFVVSALPAVTSKTGAYTATLDDGVILCGGTTSWTLGLPAAAGCANKMWWVMKTSTYEFDLTIDPNGSETINGALTMVLSAQYSGILIVCDGSNFYAFYA